MSKEFGGWLGDLSRYPSVLGRVAGMAGKAERIDYGSDSFRQVRERVLGALHPKRMTLEVTDLVEESPTTRTLRCQRLDAPPAPFRAGQYVSVSVDLAGVRTARPYSISSAPGEGHLDLTVREVPGGFVSSHLANDVPVGGLIECSGPRGHFRHEPLIDGDDLVFLAGGSGVTPFLSMLRDFERRGWPVRVHLVYGSRTEEEILFRTQLERLARGHDRLRVDHVLSEPDGPWDGPTGFLDARLLQGVLGSLAGRRFYLCGPTAMVDLVQASLRRVGVPDYLLRRELYGPPREITQDPSWPAALAADATVRLTVADRGEFEVPAAEPLLNSLERHGLAVRNFCRAGECGACRVRLVSGKVLVPPQTHVREADRRNGYIHTCSSFPIEDLVVRLP